MVKIHNPISKLHPDEEDPLASINSNRFTEIPCTASHVAGSLHLGMIEGRYVVERVVAAARRAIEAKWRKLRYRKKLLRRCWLSPVRQQKSIAERTKLNSVITVCWIR